MKVGEAPSGFRHRAFPGRGHRKALKAEPDAHPVLHNAPSRIKRVRAKGGGRQLHTVFVHKIRSFAINGESSSVMRQPSIPAASSTIAPSSRRRALRSVPSGKRDFHKVQHGEFVGVALSLRLAAEARADLEQPYRAGAQSSDFAHVFIQMRCQHGPQAAFGVDPEHLFFHDRTINTPIFSRRARDRMIGVCT